MRGALLLLTVSCALILAARGGGDADARVEQLMAEIDKLRSSLAHTRAELAAVRARTSSAEAEHDIKQCNAQLRAARQQQSAAMGRAAGLAESLRACESSPLGLFASAVRKLNTTDAFRSDFDRASAHGSDDAGDGEEEQDDEQDDEHSGPKEISIMCQQVGAQALRPPSRVPSSHPPRGQGAQVRVTDLHDDLQEQDLCLCARAVRRRRAPLTPASFPRSVLNVAAPDVSARLSLLCDGSVSMQDPSQ